MFRLLRFNWYIVVLIILIATGFVSSNFNLFLLHNDEGNTVRHLYADGEHNSLSKTLASINRFSPEHVPAYYIQLSLWAGLTNLHYVMLRIMSLFAFAISIAMLYRFAYDLFEIKVAIFAAFIFAFSAYYIYFAHNVRMYTLIVMQVIGILWSYWRIVVCGKQIRWYHWGWLWFWSVYGVYTHSLLIFPLLAIGLYHILFAPKNKQWLYVVLTELLAGIAFLPSLPSALHGATVFENLAAVNQSAPEVLWNSQFIFSNGFWVAGLVLTAIVIYQFPRKNRNFNFLIATLIIMLVTMLVVNEIVAYIPAGRMRYILVWFPSISVLWALGIVLMSNIWRYAVWIFVLGWLVMLGWFSASNELWVVTNLGITDVDKELPLSLITMTLRDNYSDLLGDSAWLVLVDHDTGYRQIKVEYYEHIFDRELEILQSIESDYQLERLGKVDNEFPGFWFGYEVDGADIILDWLDTQQAASAFDSYRACIDVNEIPEMTLQFYVHERVSCDIVTQLTDQPIRFDNDITLRNSIIDYHDGVVDVTLLWHNEDFVFDNTYGFSLQVFHSDEKVGQTDYPIDNVISQNLVELTDQSIGDYSVRIIVYSSDTQKSIGGTTIAGAIFERDIELTSFSIKTE